MTYTTERLLGIFDTLAHALHEGDVPAVAARKCGDDAGIAQPIALAMKAGHLDLVADVLTGRRTPTDAGIASRQRLGFNEHYAPRE
jgi:hypothetical protein